MTTDLLKLLSQAEQQLSEAESAIQQIEANQFSVPIMELSARITTLMTRHKEVRDRLATQATLIMEGLMPILKLLPVPGKGYPLSKIKNPRDDAQPYFTTGKLVLGTGNLGQLLISCGPKLEHVHDYPTVEKLAREYNLFELCKEILAHAQSEISLLPDNSKTADLLNAAIRHCAEISLAEVT